MFKAWKNEGFGDRNEGHFYRVIASIAGPFLALKSIKSLHHEII